MREQATKRKLRTKFSSARVITRETRNLFDANNSCSDGVVDFWHRYKSQIFFITSINFPMENETMESRNASHPSYGYRKTKREQTFGARTERERQKDMDARLVTRITRNRDAMETRSDTTRRTGSNFKKSHEGRRRSR